MTMPSLIANYQKKQTVVALKKAYTNLSQAVKLSELDNGEVEYWDFSLPGGNFFDKYLLKFVVLSNSTFNDIDVQWKYMNGEACNDDICRRYAYITYLADGSLLMLSQNRRADLKAFAVDINGLKSPNTIGKDTFVFWISKYNGLAPFGYGNFTSIDGGGSSQVFGTTYDRDIIKEDSSNNACNKNKEGFWCTALIMMDGWEIKDDYPW